MIRISTFQTLEDLTKNTSEDIIFEGEPGGVGRIVEGDNEIQLRYKVKQEI